MVNKHINKHINKYINKHIDKHINKHQHNYIYYIGKHQSITLTELLHVITIFCIYQSIITYIDHIPVTYITLHIHYLLSNTDCISINYIHIVYK